MKWKAWRRHFEANAERPLPPAPGDAGTIPVEWLADLASSLARFQAGETGEGRVAWQIQRVGWENIDDDYRVALKLFIAEEGRHARILGGWVRALGGPPAPLDHWSRKGFSFARRLVGIRMKLLVMLAAEVVGIGFYSVLADTLPPGPLQASLAELCRDEEHHLAFHGDFFRSAATSGLGRLLFRAGYWPVGLAATLACVLDHRRTLTIVGASPRETGVRMVRLLLAVDRHVMASAKREAPPESARRLA
jgi:hypothetical protein